MKNLQRIVLRTDLLLYNDKPLTDEEVQYIIQHPQEFFINNKNVVIIKSVDNNEYILICYANNKILHISEVNSIPQYIKDQIYIEPYHNEKLTALEKELSAIPELTNEYNSLRKNRLEV